MCLSPRSDDLPIDEASDLWKNLVGEPWALARFSSPPDQISHIVHISMHVAHSSIICCHFLKHKALIWMQYCNTAHCQLHMVHCQLHTVCSTLWSMWTLNILTCGVQHCRDDIFHTLDCRSNSNHITCCKFGSTNQRETQRGTWGVNGTDVRLVRCETR